MYPVQFIRVTFGFSIVSTDEIAQTGFDYAFATNLTEAALDALDLDAIGDAMEDFLSTNGLNFAGYGRFNSVKAALVGTDGHYVVDPRISNRTPASGSSNITLPQDSVVLSLRTGSTLGKGQRGRMYIPYTRLNTTSGSPYGVSQGDVATAAAAMLDAFNDEGPTGGNSVSILGQTGTGTRALVTQVLVGNVTDTQRRRRDQLQETYAAEPLSP